MRQVLTLKNTDRSSIGLQILKNTLRDIRVFDIYSMEKSILIEIVENSDSISEVCEKLGLNPKTGNTKKDIERRIKRLSIPTTHFKRSRNKWNRQKISQLVENCSTYKDILLNLGLMPVESNYTKLKKLLNDWNLKFHISLSKKYGIWEKDNLKLIVESSNSFRECLRTLSISSGGNYKTLKKYISLYNLDTSHFNSEKCLTYKKEIDEYLVENSPCSRSNLKKRLYDEGLLVPVCCLCGQDENWNGMKISLIIDHINGINDDNRIENLRIVCPNCNAGLDTFAGRNRKIFRGEKNYVCECGITILKGSKSCIECKGLKKRKVNRPPMETLLKDIDELGYRATGRKYGVSDNAVRKWYLNTSTKK